MPMNRPTSEPPMLAPTFTVIGPLGAVAAAAAGAAAGASVAEGAAGAAGALAGFAAGAGAAAGAPQPSRAVKASARSVAWDRMLSSVLHSRTAHWPEQDSERSTSGVSAVGKVPAGRRVPTPSGF